MYFLALLFSDPWHCCVQKRWHFVITEDICLKLWIFVHHLKSNLCYQGRQFKLHFLFQNYAPFYHLSSTHMWCSCLLCCKKNWTVLSLNNLNSDKWQNFGLDQIKSICRQQNKCCSYVLIFFFFFDRIENIVGKGENADYQYFLLFPQCFSKGFLVLVVKTRNCLVKGLPFPKRQILDSSNWKSLQTTISNLKKMAESYPIG